MNQRATQLWEIGKLLQLDDAYWVRCNPDLGHLLEDYPPECADRDQTLSYLAAYHFDELCSILPPLTDEGWEELIDTEQLHMKKGEYTEEKTVIMAKQKTVHTRISANKNALQGISAKATEVESLDKKYTWVKALSDTANGCVSGKDRVMLETYIQATYFERMLARANIRLQKMSGGQYDLKRREQADDQRSQSGLELDIVDHINTTERSVNTLSGGEAFLASLALALGLSDEVQMSTGIQLDTLFVDEGFGSLDPEALSKAYNTLAGLTEGNRLVGIISHVPELKERIDKQILVKKEKTGDSKAEICI